MAAYTFSSLLLFREEACLLVGFPFAPDMASAVDTTKNRPARSNPSRAVVSVLKHYFEQISEEISYLIKEFDNRTIG